MKTLILSFLLSIFFLVSFGQDDAVVKFPTDSSGNVIFTEVIKGLDNISANELYSRAKIFIAKEYVSDKTVTELNDDISHTILVKPSISNTFHYFMGTFTYGHTTYTLLIECKDSKYRYTFSGFFHHGYTDKTETLNDGGAINNDKPDGLSRNHWEGVQKQDYDHVQLLISDLKKAMATKTDDF